MICILLRFMCTYVYFTLTHTHTHTHTHLQKLTQCLHVAQEQQICVMGQHATTLQLGDTSAFAMSGDGVSAATTPTTVPLPEIAANRHLSVTALVMASVCGENTFQPSFLAVSVILAGRIRSAVSTLMASGSAVTIATASMGSVAM